MDTIACLITLCAMLNLVCKRMHSIAVGDYLVSIGPLKISYLNLNGVMVGLEPLVQFREAGAEM